MLRLLLRRLLCFWGGFGMQEPAAPTLRGFWTRVRDRLVLCGAVCLGWWAAAFLLEYVHSWIACVYVLCCARLR